MKFTELLTSPREREREGEKKEEILEIAKVKGGDFGEFLSLSSLPI